MRKVILQMGVTLDGYVAGGDWRLPPEHMDETAWELASLRHAGAHLMGRATYLEMAAHWPSATGSYAAPMNTIGW